VDLSQRRELNNGAGETLARAFELVLTPVIFAAIGWWLDGRFGIFPALSLAFFVFAFSYEFWKQYVAYDAAMRREEAKLFAPPRPDSEDPHR